MFLSENILLSEAKKKAAYLFLCSLLTYKFIQKYSLLI